MATVAHLVTTADTTGGASATSGSFTPTAGRLVFCYVAASDTVAAGSLTGSGNGLTFTRVASAVGGSGPNDTLYLFIADQEVGGSPAAMTVTFSCAGDNATGTGIMVGEIDGLTRVGTDAVRQFKTAPSTTGTPAITFDAACLTGNPTVYGHLNLTYPVTPASGWTERADSNWLTPNTGFGYHSRNSGFTGTTITAGSGLGASCLIAVEFDTTSSGGGTGALTITLDPVAMELGIADFDFEQWTGVRPIPVAMHFPMSEVGVAAASTTTTPESVAQKVVDGEWVDAVVERYSAVTGAWGPATAEELLDAVWGVS